MHRREFLKSLIVGLAAVPFAVPFEARHATVPVRCSIPQRKLYARIRISGDVIRDSVNRPPGSFMEYCRREHARVLREAAQEFDRHAVQV